MSEISINNTSLGSTLSQLLEGQSIEPGSDAGYGLCKAIWEYHPLGGKIVEKPVRLALSKPRTITIDCEPKEMLVDAFNKEWEDLGATAHIRDTMFLKRTYGASAIVYGAPDIPTTEPIDPWKLSDLNLYFNQLDPLNLAGSIVTNQNPNAPDFQKPLAYTTAAGQPYHPSRSVVVFNGTPIYLSFQSSTFGFTGRSVFQRSLYPLKSFIQSMITDDMVTYKAGLLIAKQKPAGSIVNRLMQQAANIKREYLQRGATGNVLSIDIDESIEAINLQNTDTAMKTARDNIIANIAAASDVPAILLRDEAFTQGFGEGTEDTKAIVQYVDGIREEMRTLFKFFDKIVMHRAWNKEFFEAVQNKYPDLYKNKTYQQAFYHWEKNFKADWESLMEEPESEKVKIWETKVKAINEVLRTTLPIIDPQNKAFLMQWAVDNINEMPDMFQSTLQLDADLLAEYEPPQNAMPEERMPRSDSAIGSAPVVINNSYGRHRHDADFVESDHPRGEDGKFVAGAGGGGAGGGGREVAAITAPMPASTAKRMTELPPLREKYKGNKKAYLASSFNKSDITSLKPEAQEKITAMYEKAAEVKDKFDETNKKIAESLGGKAAIVPLKGTQRAVEKVNADYKGDPSKIRDLLRTTIEINKPSDVENAIEKIKAQYGEPVKIRNALSESAPSVGGSGYRDVNMTVEIDGAYAEVQINFPAMLKAKEELHKNYEVVRSIQAKANIDKRGLTAEEEAEIEKQEKTMIEGYEAAWQSFLASSKAS